MGQSSCTDVMLMMRPPPPWAIICLAASWVPKNALFRLMARTFSYWSSVVSRTEVRVSIAGVVDHDVQPAEARDRRVDHPLQVLDLRDVRLHGDRHLPQAGDLLLQLLGGLLVADVVDDDLGALARPKPPRPPYRCPCCLRSRWRPCLGVRRPCALPRRPRGRVLERWSVPYRVGRPNAIDDLGRRKSPHGVTRSRRRVTSWSLSCPCHFDRRQPNRVVQPL